MGLREERPRNDAPHHNELTLREINDLRSVVDDADADRNDAINETVQNPGNE